MKLLTFRQQQKTEESKYIWYSPDFGGENCTFYCLDLENFQIKEYAGNRLKKAGLLNLYDNDFLYEKRMRNRFFYLCNGTDIEIGKYLLSHVEGWTKGLCYYKNTIYNLSNTQYIGIICFRFNLRRWRAQWMSIMCMSGAIESCTEFDNKIIIIVSDSKSLHIYDCFTNSYTEMKSIFNTLGCKHLYKYDDKLYIFDYGENIIYVTKSCFEDWQVLAKINENIDEIGTEWFPQLYTYYKASLYISIKGKIYRFDFNEKGLILIGEINLDISSELYLSFSQNNH